TSAQINSVLLTIRPAGIAVVTTEFCVRPDVTPPAEVHERLHTTVALPVLSMLTAVTFAVNGVARYGVMIEDEALNTLAMSVSVTDVACEIRSDTVCDTIVTLRSIAT